MGYILFHTSIKCAASDFLGCGDPRSARDLSLVLRTLPTQGLELLGMAVRIPLHFPSLNSPTFLVVLFDAPAPCPLASQIIPAYTAFPSLWALSSSASSSCNLCFSLSSEALALRVSSLCSAKNSVRAMLRSDCGSHRINRHSPHELCLPLGTW